MLKLNTGFMRELKNSEFGVLVNTVADSLSRIETNEQPLKQIIERIQHHSREMYYLEDQTPCHPLTEVIGELTRKRTNYLISLRLQVEGKMLSHKVHEQECANHLYRWLQNNKKYLYVASIIPQTGRIMGLLEEKRRYPIIEQSLIDLGFDDLLDAIVEVTSQIEQYDSKRMDDKPEKSRKGIELRKAAYKDINALVGILIVMMDIHPENTFENIYYNVASNVQLHLKKSHTKLKSRTTKRENKKNMANAVAKLVRATEGKEKAVMPNKKLTEVLLEGYLMKESKVLTYSMLEAEEEVKNRLLIMDKKRKATIGKDWLWKLPQIGVN